MDKQPDKLILDWESLAKLSRRPKLAGVATDPEALFDGYYRISDSEYLNAEYQWDDDFTEQALHVNSFIWAPTFETFRRAISRKSADLLQDDGVTQLLPKEFRFAPDCITYGTMAAYLFENSFVRTGHYDLYDEKDTAIGSYLVVEPWLCYFRSPKLVPADEPPFAVKLVMNRRLFIPAGG